MRRDSAFITRKERDAWERFFASAPISRRAEAAAVVKGGVEADLERLRKRVAELESEPDPGQAPYRGTSVVVASTPDAERPSALKAAQERDEREQTAHLERLADNHPDPVMRGRARSALVRRGVIA